MSERLGGSGIDNPDIRPGAIDNPDFRDGGIQDPDMRPSDGTIDNPDYTPQSEAIDNPEFRPTDEVHVDDPNLRPGDDVALHEVNDRPADQIQVNDGNIRPETVNDPEIRVGVDNPDLTPGSQPLSGGLPLIPMVIVVGLVVVGVAAFSILNSGAAPSSSAAPGGTNGAVVPGSSTVVGGPGSTDPTATLTIVGLADAPGPWTLDGISGNVSPTATLIAAVWTKTEDNVAAGYGDLVTISLGGKVFSGTQATSDEGIGLTFGILRSNAAGEDVFDHTFTSKAGECQVTMAVGSDISGSFTCASITSSAGVTVSASGTFKT